MNDAAYHEAGHAVVALALGGKVLGVWIDNAGGGECRAECGVGEVPVMQMAIRLCFLLGGPLAKARAEIGGDVDEHDPGNAVDFQQIRPLITTYYKEFENRATTDVLRTGFYLAQKRRASEILARCWPAVGAIANELVCTGKCSGDRAAMLYALAPELVN